MNLRRRAAADECRIPPDDEARLSALLQFLPERNHQHVFLPLLEGKRRGQREKIAVVVILPRLRARAQESLFDAFSDGEEKIIQVVEIAFLVRRHELLSFDFAFVRHFRPSKNRFVVPPSGGSLWCREMDMRLGLPPEGGTTNSYLANSIPYSRGLCTPLKGY